MSDNKPKHKYTPIGLYKKPSKAAQEKGIKRGSLFVNLGKKGPPNITIKSGDILDFTPRAEKLKNLEKAHAEGKLSDDLFEYFSNVFADEDVIAEVTLKQKL